MIIASRRQVKDYIKGMDKAALSGHHCRVMLRSMFSNKGVVKTNKTQEEQPIKKNDETVE